MEIKVLQQVTKKLKASQKSFNRYKNLINTLIFSLYFILISTFFLKLFNIKFLGYSISFISIISLYVVIFLLNQTRKFLIYKQKLIGNRITDAQDQQNYLVKQYFSYFSNPVEKNIMKEIKNVELKKLANKIK